MSLLPPFAMPRGRGEHPLADENLGVANDVDCQTDSSSSGTLDEQKMGEGSGFERVDSSRRDCLRRDDPSPY